MEADAHQNSAVRAEIPASYVARVQTRRREMRYNLNYRNFERAGNGLLLQMARQYLGEGSE